MGFYPVNANAKGYCDLRRPTSALTYFCGNSRAFVSLIYLLMKSGFFSIILLFAAIDSFGSQGEPAVEMDSVCICLERMLLDIEENDTISNGDYDYLFQYISGTLAYSDSSDFDQAVTEAYLALRKDCTALLGDDFLKGLEDGVSDEKTEKRGSKRMLIKIGGLVLAALILVIGLKWINTQYDRLNERLNAALRSVLGNHPGAAPALIDTYELQSYTGIGQRFIKGADPIVISLYDSCIEYKYKECCVRLNFSSIQEAGFIAVRSGNYIDVFLSLQFEQADVEFTGVDDDVRLELLNLLSRVRIRKSNARLKGEKGTTFRTALIETVEGYRDAWVEGSQGV